MSGDKNPADEARKRALIELASKYHELAQACVNGSRELMAIGAPATKGNEALFIGRQLLGLALALEELAQDAAPMPGRD